MLKQKETVFIWFLLLLGLAAYGAGAMQVQKHRDRLDPTQIVSALQMRPEVLEILSGEFRSLLADYLLLKASVYLGGREEASNAKKNAVSTLFRQAANLDPYFFQTCYFVQGYLPWWKGRFVNHAIEALEFFLEHRDWDWQPGFFLGFDHLYFLKEPLSAAGYLMEASKKPKAPTLLGLLGARLSQKGGQTGASIAFLKAMHASTEKEVVRADIERRIAALEGILILDKAIAQFKSLFFGHPPDTLERLVETGILERLPENPWRSDETYVYENGNIDF